MATLDYTPIVDGVVVDPALTGGAVTELRLFGSPERTGSPMQTVGPAVRVSPGVYRFTLPNLVGRYWTTVRWLAAPMTQPYSDDTGRVDLPYDPRLIVTPEDVASRLKLSLPLTASQREAIVDEILDVQDQVEGYLRRPLHPRTETLSGLVPYLGWERSDPRTWDASARFGDRVSVRSVSAEGNDGTFTVTFVVGMDGAQEPAIRRYVLNTVGERLRSDPGGGWGQRRVTSASAEGQSVSYADSGGSEGGAGLESLRSLRRHAIYTRKSPPHAPWPYSSARYAYDSGW